MAHSVMASRRVSGVAVPSTRTAPRRLTCVCSLPGSFEPGRPSTSPGALRPSSPRENRVQSSQAIPAHMDGVSLLKVEDSRDMLGDDTPPFMETRKTKIVCTIGPGTNTRETLFKLADEGMNVARLNMSHGDHASHKEVVDLIKEYNSLGGKTVAILLDTKGPEVRSGDLKVPIELSKGEKFTFTITPPGPEGYDDRTTCVNYDGFIDDVSVGDRLLVDGGIMSFDVLSKTATNVMCEVVDGGTLASRRHLNIRGKSANLPAITDRDWADINFGIDCGVDYYALSFVRDGQVVRDLKKHLAQRGAVIGVLSKIESADSIHNLDDILDSSDGAMVARGDLGAELPFEEVPFWQSNIIQGCRRRGKPVIVATNMLESMISNPTPTRAEVSDIAIAVRQGTDSVMLSGETAYGAFPFKSVNVMGTVARNTEQAMRSYKGSRRFGSEDSAPIDWISPPRAAKSVYGQPECSLSEMLAFHTTTMANALRAPIVVFSHKGTMPSLLSHYRPDYPIFAFTDSPAVKRRLALYHGVTSIQLQFSTTAEATFDAGIQELVRRCLLVGGEQVVMVQSGRKPIWRASSTHAISVRKVPFMYSSSDDEDVI